MRIKSITLPLSIVAFLFASLEIGYSHGKELIQPAKAPITPVSCLTYDYLDLDYGITDFDNPILDDGGYRWGINFSKSLGETFFLTGGYTNAGVDYFSNNQYFNAESHRYSLGLGAHFALKECVDLTIEGGVTHTDNRFRGNNTVLGIDGWGYYVAPGIRARKGRFEGFARAVYFDRESLNNNININTNGWVFQPGFLFHLTDTLAFKVAADITDENAAVTFGARIHF